MDTSDGYTTDRSCKSEEIRTKKKTERGKTLDGQSSSSKFKKPSSTSSRTLNKPFITPDTNPVKGASHSAGPTPLQGEKLLLVQKKLKTLELESQEKDLLLEKRNSENITLKLENEQLKEKLKNFEEQLIVIQRQVFLLSEKLELAQNEKQNLIINNQNLSAHLRQMESDKQKLLNLEHSRKRPREEASTSSPDKDDEMQVSDNEKINTKETQNLDSATPASSDEEEEGFVTVDKKGKRKANINEKNMNVNKEKNPLFMPHNDLSLAGKSAQPNIQKVPKVVIRDTSNWAAKYKMIAENKINLLKTQKDRLGLALFPKTPQDHRALTGLLRERGVEFHSFFLEEDRKLNVILRGLDRNFNLKEVEEELRSMGFEPEELGWFNTGPGQKRPTDIIRFLVPKEQDNIFKIENILKIKVRVERLKTYKIDNIRQIGQCHRCQECEAPPLRPRRATLPQVCRPPNRTDKRNDDAIAAQDADSVYCRFRHMEF
ncbi:uncharacterized protein LOC126745943 [Anthonomus grandis grandis]|uniref:uncharacterized protein LOC126745943 n=1 Tax=Anthonomus grandis grandis TaxID=2921223 RepID=UPI002166B682|nr:uncharacterized protein LOC126745943 [Anthonomus grandis grandis]